MTFRAGRLFWAAIGICLLVQLALSAYSAVNLVVLLLFVSIMTVFALIVSYGSLFSVPTLLAVLYIFNNVIFAFFLKTLLLQPLSSNLFAPVSSYLATLVACIALFCAIHIAKIINVGRPFFQPIRDLRLLKWLSIYAFGVGATSWVLNQLFLIDRRSDLYDPKKSFGGFAIFDDFMYLSIAAATAYVLISSKKKKSLNIYNVLLLVLTSIMALIDSRKIVIGLAYLSYMMTCIFFRAEFTKKQMAAIVGFFLFAYFVFTPIAHVNRKVLWYVPFDQKIEYIMNHIHEIISPQTIVEYYHDISERNYNNYEYFGRKMSFVDRFAAIQINDELIGSVDATGLSRSKFYLTDYQLILPKVLYPKKETIDIGDKLRWEYNLKRLGIISYSTAPLICNGYSVGKNLGVFLLCLYFFCLLFVLYKKLGWSLSENVLCIFCVQRWVFLVHQGSHAQWVTAVFREIPAQVALIMVFIVCTRFLVGRSFLANMRYRKVV
jgi:hypothetical protein